jgi:hypothetical protein
MARLITNPAANWLYSAEPEANEEAAFVCRRAGNGGLITPSSPA